MKSLLVISFVFISMIVNAQVPELNWVKGAGSGGKDSGLSLTVDAFGNTYVTGFFQNTVDFDPGPGTFNLTSNGESDIFIQKIDLNGEFVWAVSVGGEHGDGGYKIEINNSGNIVVCGSFWGTVDFDPGIDSAFIYGSTHTESFVMEVDPNGLYVWAGAFLGTYGSTPTDFSFDSEGNRYTIGYFAGTLDMDPGPGVFELIAEGTQNWWDIYIQKMDSANNFIWAKQIGGDVDEYSTNIELDPNNNIVINGHHAGTTDFDPGPGTYYLTSVTPWPYDYFLVKLNSDGEFRWAFSLGSPTADYGEALSIDNSGNIYSIGKFGGTLDFDPGPNVYNLTAGIWDVFIQKLDSNGNFLWAKSYGNGYPFIHESAVDEQGSIYSTGVYMGSVDFDPGPGVYELDSLGLWDAFIQKLDSTGEFCWAKGFGGKDYDEGEGIDVDSFGAVYLTGSFQDTANFSNLNPESTLISNGGQDVFLLKLDTGYIPPYISYQNHCFGDTTYFEINPFSSSQTILWNFGDTASGVNNTSTLPNPGHLFTSPGHYTVTAIVDDGSSSITVSYTVEISSGPAIGVFIAGTDSICQGQSQVLYAITTIDDADSISWSLMPDSAGTILGSDTIIYINFSSSFFGPVVLSANGVNECGTGDSVFYNINVIGHPQSQAGTSAIVCENESHTLNGEALNHSMAIWTTTGDGSFDDPFLLNATYTPGPADIENGNVYLVLYAFAIDPCIFAESDSMLLTLKDLPEQPETPIGPTQIIIEPGVSSEYSTNTVLYADDYIWHLQPVESGNLAETDTMAIIYWNEAFTGTSAYLSVEAENECGRITSDTLAINLAPVGITESIHLNDQVSIHPNPSDGVFYIETHSFIGEVMLSVFCPRGVVIQEDKISFQNPEDSYKLDLSGQLSGIYYLRLSNNDLHIVKKVILQ